MNRTIILVALLITACGGPEVAHEPSGKWVLHLAGQTADATTVISKQADGSYSIAYKTFGSVKGCVSFSGSSLTLDGDRLAGPVTEDWSDGRLTVTKMSADFTDDTMSGTIGPDSFTAERL